MKIYLMAMAVRLFEMKRVLKPTGSIYLHCDPTASHYLKLVMDGLFGKDNFQTEITWQRTSAHNDRVFGNVSDIILFCGDKAQDRKDNRLPLDPDYVKNNYRRKDERGFWQSVDLTGPKTSSGASGKPWRGFDPVTYGDRCWSVPKKGEYAKYIDEVLAPGYLAKRGIHERLDFLDKHNLLHFPKTGTLPRLKRYLIPNQGKLPTSVWTDIPPLPKSAKENTGYPTQKPLKLLERIIKASSNEGDVVLDPFCGCATACVAAEQLNRQWMGIDISPSAEDITKLRLQEIVDKEVNAFPLFNPLTDVFVENAPPVPTSKRADSECGRESGKREETVQVNLPAARAHKHELYGLQEGKCVLCKFHFPFRNMTIDHIIPQAKGGTDRKDNLQLLCQACNSTKGTGTQEEAVAKVQAQGALAMEQSAQEDAA